MFGKLLDTTAIDAFAARVAKELPKTLPPDRCSDASKQGERRREQAHERIGRQAAALLAATRLNVYQKAKLGIRLQDALEAAGYPVTFSKPFAHEVVTQVALAAMRRP